MNSAYSSLDRDLLEYIFILKKELYVDFGFKREHERCLAPSREQSLWKTNMGYRVIRQFCGKRANMGSENKSMLIVLMSLNMLAYVYCICSVFIQKISLGFQYSLAFTLLTRTLSVGYLILVPLFESTSWRSSISCTGSMFRDITRTDVVTRRFASYETTTHMLLGHSVGRAQMHMRVKKATVLNNGRNFKKKMGSHYFNLADHHICQERNIRQRSLNLGFRNNFKFVVLRYRPNSKI